MQAQHYTLALAVAWIATLTFLPMLFALARKRAFDLGHATGLEMRDAVNWRRLQALDNTLSERAVSREQEQRQFMQTKAALQGRINELEERVMSYTGLAVTANDLTLVNNAAETLDLAHRTFNAIKGTEAWRARSFSEASGLRRLAELMHVEIRQKTAASGAKPEVAA